VWNWLELGYDAWVLELGFGSGLGLKNVFPICVGMPFNTHSALYIYCIKSRGVIKASYVFATDVKLSGHSEYMFINVIVCCMV
jgi:hypothetical protein